MDCLLVADDLTGACDAAVHFAMRGLRPTVVRLPGQPYSHAPRVLACSTESREMAPAGIRAALHALSAEFEAVSPIRVFKKIDSTLRGNVGMEVAAARDAFGCDAAVICPAFPAMRRVVEQGILHAPLLAAVDVAERMRDQSGETCVPVRPQDLAAALASGARLISLDAGNDADLDHIAMALESGAAGCRILWAGSAGLASALARRMGGDAETLPIGVRGPVLCCIGSDHAVTMAQLHALQTDRSCALHEPAALAAGQHVVMRIPRGRITSDEVRARIAGARPAALVVSGGDTASLVFRAIGACAIELHAEIVPGVPYGILLGGVFHGLPVVTKSGGFGDRDTLVNVADFFHAPI